jgi:monoamine oxidase
MKHVIIGAGITGLYLAYKLISIKNVSPEDIVIYEKNNRIGGRIYTYSNKGFNYSVGAGRLGKKHKYVMKLIKDFNLLDQIIDIGKDKGYYINGKMMTEKELLAYYKSNYSSLDKLWDYAINKNVKVNKHDYNLHNYLSLFLPTNEVEVLNKSLGYIGEIYDMNAHNAILTLRKDFDVKNNEFFVLKEGIQKLCDVLYGYLKSRNVKIEFNTLLTDIDDTNKTYNVNNKKYKYTKLYLTLTRGDYLNIPYFKKYENVLNSVNDGKLLRIYAQFKDVWFKDMPKTLTDNKLQFIIPINYNSGLIQISYTDSYNAEFWNTFKDEKSVKKHIKKLLDEMFPDKKIKEPEWITMHYWSSGDHMWKVGINSNKIQNTIDDLFTKKDIYILGETYCDRQAWVEGAIETVHKKILI